MILLKKKKILILITAIFSSVIIACSNTTSSDNNTTPSDTEEIVYNTNTGTAQWATTLEAPAPSGGYSDFKGIAVDTSGNIFAGGDINGTGTFNFGNSVTINGTTSSRNFVLVKYNSNGEAQWAKTWFDAPDSTYQIIYDIDTDQDGNIYITGSVPGSATPYKFSNTVSITINNSLNRNFFIAKFNSSGTALWAKTINTATEESTGYSIATDNNGNVYASSYNGNASTYNFGNGVSYTSLGYSQSFIIKYSTEGVPQWAKGPTSGTSQVVYHSVDCDSSGNVFTVGYINGTSSIDFGDGISLSGVNASRNILLVKYDTSGTAKFAKTLTVAPGMSWLDGISIDKRNGNIYAVGSIGGTGEFGFENSITAQVTNGSSNYNGILLKFDSNGVAQFASVLADAKSKNQKFNRIDVDSNGYIFLTGFCTDSDTFDFGNSVTGLSPESGNNPFVAKYNSSGIAQFVKFQTVRPDSCKYNSLAVHSDGKLYIGGYLNSTGLFNFGDSITAEGVVNSNTNHFIVEFK